MSMGQLPPRPRPPARPVRARPPVVRGPYSDPWDVPPAEPVRRERAHARPKTPVRRDPAQYEPIPPNVAVERARGAGEWIGIILLAVLVALFVKTFVVQAFFIPSGSMENTLLVHDRILVSKLAYVHSSINRGDVIVFRRPPGETDPSVNDLIKRVIAVSGDTVQTRNGVVFVNDQPVDEPYLAPGTLTTDVQTGGDLPKTTIPDHMLFVMGDNRGNSSDSRVFGPINKNLVIGQAFVRVWPLTGIKRL